MSNNKYQLSNEEELNNNFSSNINDFWRTHAKVEVFESKHGGTINTVHITKKHSKAIVITQGRTESALKYKELAFDLYNQGYDIFFIDHRGQGNSSRLSIDTHRGHVEDFQHYVTDLKTFVDSLQLTKQYQTSFLLSHSMGGAISALYLEEQAHPFQAAAFFSPMLSINLRGLPVFLAKIISFFSDRTCRFFGKKDCNAPGSKIYNPIIFDKNLLTNSSKRYCSMLATFNESIETQLGGPTMRWVNESLFAMERAIKNAVNIDIPVLIIQSGADKVVTAKGQKQFFNKIKHNKSNVFLTISGAKHELLIEQDKYRLPALTAALDFFEQYSKGK